MLVCLSGVLSPEDLATVRAELAAADWESGLQTAGHQAAHVKNNRQLPVSSPLCQHLGRQIANVLLGNPRFVSAALPLRILPPMFNAYAGGEQFGVHVDNSIRVMPGSQTQMRSDLSCTLFLSDPESYDGGELVIEGDFGSQEVKLPAGDLVLYPAGSLHKVEPVTRGERVAAFFWVQSMIRDDRSRALLYELDRSIQELQARSATIDPVAVRLSGTYHNLLRAWAEM